jgi:serine/threonine-protein kinase HipA
LTIRRFDRVGTIRLHCLSAKTLLRAARLEESYPALATILLRVSHADRQTMMREELFKRMVFNILMDNTDDHHRNHCLRLGFDGKYELSPAYDVVPTLQNMGYQAMVVGTSGMESTLENALTELSEFGIKKPRAQALIAEVARVVDQWPQHFAQHGVCTSDMELLHASLDRDALKLQRQAYSR